MTRAAAVALGALLCVGGAACTRSLDGDAWCKEAAFAIAGRTEECTGDTSLATARFEAFFDQYTCADIPPETMGADTAAAVAPQDLAHCALAIRNLPCVLVDDYGDQLDLYLSASPVCAAVVGGAP
ncbi:MAG: hypothetical protein RL071_3570 [Pseudomonadota bacterium]